MRANWIGIGVAAAAVIAGICLGSEPGAFIDVPSLLFVLLTGGGIVVAAHGSKAWQLTFKAVFGFVSDEHRVATAEMLQTGIRAFVAAGWIGVLIGVVQMLCALDDPAALGPPMALALLTALYGHIIAYLVCMPLARSVTTKPVGAGRLPGQFSA